MYIVIITLLIMGFLINKIVQKKTTGSISPIKRKENIFKGLKF